MIRHLVELLAKIRKFAADTSGATAIEYGLIAGGIAIAIVVTVGLLGTKLDAVFTNIAGKL